MKTILVADFAAFGHTPVNPAERAARVVPNTFFTRIDVVRAAIGAVHAHPADIADPIASRPQI